MRAFPLITWTLLIPPLACANAQTARGVSATTTHAKLLQALLTHHAQQLDRFASDARMLQQMDRLKQELTQHQAPKAWQPLKGDRLLEAVAKDIAEVGEIFEKRILDLGLDQPFALIPPERRPALEQLAALYKGYLQVLAPYKKAIRALETKAAKGGTYFPVLSEEP